MTIAAVAPETIMLFWKKIGNALCASTKRKCSKLVRDGHIRTPSE